MGLIEIQITATAGDRSETATVEIPGDLLTLQWPTNDRRQDAAMRKVEGAVVGLLRRLR